MIKRTTAVLPVVFLLVLGVATAASGETLLEGFERRNPFTPEDNVTALENTAEYFSEGVQSLKINYSALTLGAHILLKAEGEQNWTRFDGLQLDIFNPNDSEMSVALALQTGSGWTWYEYELVEVEPGENKDLTFFLKENLWKAEATGWQHTTKPELSNIMGYCLMIYNTGDDLPAGTLYMDNIRLLSQEALAATAAAGIDIDVAPKRHSISGDVNLRVVSQLAEVVQNEDALVELPPTDFEMFEGAGELEIVNMPDRLGRRKDAVEAKYFVDWASTMVYHIPATEDKSDWQGFIFDIYLQEDTQLQVAVAYGETGWHEVENCVDLAAGWHFMKYYGDSYSDIEWTDLKSIMIKKGSSDGTEDFYVTNAYAVKDDLITEDSDVLNTTTNVVLNLDYQLSPDWQASITGVFGDPVVDLGSAAVTGDLGPAEVEFYFHKTSADLADPMNLYQGDRFFTGATAGVDLQGYAGAVEYHGMLHTAFDGQLIEDNKWGYEARDEVMLAGKAGMPVTDYLNAELLAAGRLDDFDDNHFVSAVADFELGDLFLTLQGATTGFNIEKLRWYSGWYLRGSYTLDKVYLEGTATECGRELWREYADLTKTDVAFGEYMVRSEVEVMPEVKLGLRGETYYDHDEEGELNFCDVYGEASLDVKALPMVDLYAKYEQKVEGDDYDNLELDYNKLYLKGAGSWHDIDAAVELTVEDATVNDKPRYLANPTLSTTLATVLYGVDSSLQLKLETYQDDYDSEYFHYFATPSIITKASGMVTDQLSAGLELRLRSAREDWETIDYFVLPTVIAKAGYAPEPGLNITAEVARHREEKDGDLLKNVYLTVTKDIDPGVLEFTYGSASLDEDGEYIKDQTKNYYTLQYSLYF